MPRIKKTSSQPKRKPKVLPKIPEPVYPEYIKNFIEQIKQKTPFTVKVDQYSDGASYHIGVIAKISKSNRCIWMVNFATGPEHLRPFWSSMAFESHMKN
jgi:hypothetical protein